jgi:hypothetical protein
LILHQILQAPLIAPFGSKDWTRSGAFFDQVEPLDRQEIAAK